MNASSFALQTHICWTGRFQPPHVGHLNILQESMHQFAMPHACLLSAVSDVDGSDAYARLSRSQYARSKNPFTLWERLELMKLSLLSRDWAQPVAVIPTPRYAENWTLASQFYPPRRIIGITTKDAFELAKVDKWRSLGEHVEVMHNPRGQEWLTTTTIKARIAAGEDWRVFIAETAHNYFAEIDGPTRLVPDTK